MSPAGNMAGDAAHDHEKRLESLIGRLPSRLQAPTRWLRRPSSCWARVPAGLLLIGGGFLSILPLFGLWMLPLGLMLLSEDIPLLRRARGRLLKRLEHRRPHWFYQHRSPTATGDRPSTADTGSLSTTSHQ